MRVYAYARGTPVTRRDPSGLIVQFNQDPLAAAQIAVLAAAYAQIGQSFMGAMLENELENSPLIYTITNTADQMNGSSGDFNQYTNTIHVNPGYHPVIPVNGSCGGTAYEAASPREVLEHELGHATGVLDELANMNQNVNPFRAEMGLPALSIANGFIGGFQYFTPTMLPYTGASLVLPPAR